MIFKHMDGIIRSQSRNHKPVTGDVREIERQCEFILNHLPEGACLDGELYKHGLGFQTIVSLVKNSGKKKVKKDKVTGKPIVDLSLLKTLEYHIYDWQDKDCILNNTERNNLLVKAFESVDSKLISRIKLVPTVTGIIDESQAKQAYAQFLEDKYEGLMLRNPTGVYEQKRSKNLIKMKPFDTEEFKIIGYKEGKGSKEAMPIWQVQDVKLPSIIFDVMPRGDDETRREMWINRDRYIGKMLTVRYQGRSTDNTPRFGVGIIVRDYE
jgi:ATP-dependent DNA ligase